MHHPYTPELETAIQAIHTASILTKPLSFHSHSPTSKSDSSPVTIADFAAQAIIISYIKHAFPEDAFVGEEDATVLRRDHELARRVWGLIQKTMVDWHDVGIGIGSIEEMLDLIDAGAAESNSSGRVWYLDPIDGTASFIRGQQYAVSIALIENGEQSVGVVGCPNLPFACTRVSEEVVDDGFGMMLSSVKGFGAWKLQIFRTHLGHPQRILREKKDVKDGESAIHFTESLSSPSICPKTHALIRSTLTATATTTKTNTNTNNLTNIHSMQVKYASLSLSLCDAMIRIPKDAEYRDYAWDHAGGMLVFQEAGGVITDLEGRGVSFGGRKLDGGWGMVAAWPGVHGRVLGVVGELLG